MNGFLLDTNVVSETRKRRPAPPVLQWLASPPGPLYLSVIVVGELTRGVTLLRRANEPQAAALDTWLEGLQRDYRDRLLPVSLEIAKTWGTLSAARSLPVADGLLAATALVHDLTLVTRNIKDVASTGARLLDPFRG